MHLPVISAAHVPQTELDVMDTMISEGWFVLASPTGRQVSGPWAVVVSTDPSDRDGDLWELVPVLQSILNALHGAGFHHLRLDAECGDVFTDLRDYVAEPSNSRKRNEDGPRPRLRAC